MNDLFQIYRTNVLIILSIVLFGGAFVPTKLIAQQTDSLWRDIDYIRACEAQLSSYNATGLRYLPVNSISEAKIYMLKNNGKLINFYQSNNSFKLGADIESYYRLNKKSVFYGKISYNSFKGRNMGGSFFIEPNYNPLDILEVADSTRGTKKQELYHLIGGASLDILPKLSLGGRVDYKVGNYAKQKDLRNKNKILDLKLTIGASYRPKKGLELGANYYFNRSVESLLFSTEGNADKTYESLISVGNFIGRKEQFGENGFYTAKSKRTPMVNKLHGASIQFQISPFKWVSIFNEITYKSRKGYYGVSATSSIVLTEHNSDIFEYSGTFTLERDQTLHSFNINIKHEDLKNRENIFREETVPGELPVISYYGQSDILKKEEVKANATYSGYFGVKNYNPKWEVKAKLNYYRRLQTASLYPFYRKQTVNSYAIDLFAKHNIRTNKNMYSIYLSSSYRQGNGTPQYNGLYSEPSDSQKAMYKSIDRYLYREYEYLTAKQLRAGIGVRYSTIFIKEMKTYVQADYSCSKAFHIKYLEGKFTHTLGLTLGCTF